MMTAIKNLDDKHWTSLLILYILYIWNKKKICSAIAPRYDLIPACRFSGFPNLIEENVWKSNLSHLPEVYPERTDQKDHHGNTMYVFDVTVGKHTRKIRSPNVLELNPRALHIFFCLFHLCKYSLEFPAQF